MVAKNPQSEELRSIILERLESCDEDTIAKIADVIDSSEDGTRGEAVFFSDGVTRRQFLVGLTAGGAALVSTNLATGLAAGSLGMKAGQAAAGLDSEAELMKLRGLLTLYEQLERVGIDAILTTGIAALAISLDGLEAGIVVLEKGVSLVDAGVTAFENSFPTIRRGLRVVESLFTSMENRVTQLQETMSEIQEVVSPLSDAVGSFLSSLVERIPGVGPAILDALDRISELVGSLPDAIGEVRIRLLEPLREEWFTDDEESGIKGRLLNPLQERLLEPLEKFLGNLADSMDTWQEQLITPVEQAVRERELIRQQITEYKEREGMV
ncbi:MAG: hypothetical protein GTO63_30870 [Anaerolineae bacterium]|nr:hypothetical protein [Anaerolineae bacterium]NIN99098.1 hypothetical protein [Anaerolineae bacterium]NIQ81942.1 hypothetical protein [Anaerolineae bacterium]